jgi:hypothetical protein
MEVTDLSFPLTHPTSCVRKYKWDRYTTANHFGVSYPSDKAVQLADRIEMEADKWFHRGKRLKNEPLSAISGKLKQILK